MFSSFSPVGRDTWPHVRERTCLSHYRGKAIRVVCRSFWHGQHHWRDHRGSLCLQLPGRTLALGSLLSITTLASPLGLVNFPGVSCFVAVRKSAPPDWFLKFLMLCHSSVSLTIQLNFTAHRQAALDRAGKEPWLRRFPKGLQQGHVGSSESNLEISLTSQVRLPACVSHLMRCWLSCWQDDMFDVLTSLGVQGWEGISGWKQKISHITSLKALAL